MFHIWSAECQVGHFGDECKHKCHCADNQPCDRETGKCSLQICKIGYSGPACDEGYFVFYHITYIQLQTNLCLYKALPP